MTNFLKRYWVCLGAVLSFIVMLEQTGLADELSATGKKYDITVSSVLSSTKNLYSVEHLFGYDPSRTWCKGKQGDGIGEWIDIDFKGEPESKYIDYLKLKLLPGYTKTKKLFTANARPSKINVEVIDRVAKSVLTSQKSYQFNVQDRPALQVFTIPIRRELDTSKLRVLIKVEDVYKGSVYKDMCVSEVNVDLIGKKKKILDMTPEEYAERQSSLKDEASVIKKDFPLAIKGNESSIQRLERLVSGEYIKSAEGGEWLNEIYLDLMVKQPYVFFSILTKQEDEVISLMQQQLLHPVKDKYSRGQLLSAINEAKRKGIESPIIEDLTKRY